MLTNMNELIANALKNKIAIPQFNINNLEWTKYILTEANNLKYPVILGVTEKAVSYIGGYTTVVNMVVGLMIDLKISIPVVIHLDHGKSFESCKEAIDAGFTSVMIDASNLDIENNIALTSKVVEYAKKYNVSVEGEIGALSSKTTSTKEECSLFAASTGIDALAPSVGNKHGIYEEKPNINYELLKEISKSTLIPLVLHGGSGLSDEEFLKAIDSGVSKININTLLQQKWTEGIKKYINDNPNDYDPRNLISSGCDNMVKYIRNIFSLFNRN